MAVENKYFEFVIPEERTNMENLKYNYVFFNSSDANSRKRNPNGYNTICVSDLYNLENVTVVSYPLDYAPYLTRLIFSVHHTPKINNLIKLPLKSLWYPFYFRSCFPEERPICFVFTGMSMLKSKGYLKYLKKRYPGCAMVLLLRDLLRVANRTAPELKDAIAEDFFDLTMTIDEVEAQKYGMIHFDEFESAIHIEPSENYLKYDIFFAGRAKDRLDKLMAIYHKLTEAGLKCNYYLMGVPKEKQVALPGIEYADKTMSYREMLQRTIDARCVLEINQADAVGYTSRFLEAVIYNKKLITDNQTIKKTKFYNPQFIQCISTAEDLDVSFITDDQPVDFQYNGEFSPIRLIEQIEKELNTKDRNM